jgi:hypothetical protein
MAKRTKIKRLTSAPSGKNRGRTAKTTSPDGPNPTEGHVTQERLTEVNRAIGNGGGKQRGDRRDTSRLYTNNTKHASRGSNPRADVKTRKR